MNKQYVKNMKSLKIKNIILNVLIKNTFNIESFGELNIGFMLRKNG